MYHNHGENSGRGHSDCSFTMAAIQNNFPNIVSGQMPFDEIRMTRQDFRDILSDFKTKSRSESDYKIYQVLVTEYIPS